MTKALKLTTLLLGCSMAALATKPPVTAGNSAYFNSLRTISTAVPIIAVSPDSRAGGMGDVGVASSPDGASLYWNPAKLAFLDKKANSLNISYTPWLNKLVSDINLAYISYVFKLDDRQGMGFAMRYFSLGQINFKNESNQDAGTGQPYEFTLNGAYSIKLSEQMSLAVGLRYIFSDLLNGVNNNQGINTTPGKSFAADIGYYYQSREFNMEGGKKQSFAAGIDLQNMGGKISYGNDAQSDFIPTNLRIGGAYNLQFDQYNRIAFLADVNKLLVPTPVAIEGKNGVPEDANGNGIPNEALGNEDVNAFQGMLQSFTDAPGGAKEEFEEIVFNVGAEFWYDDHFALRGGYQYEDPQKGGRKYFTLGLGIKYNVFGLDFAYLIPASATVKSPLENTLRFTLHFNFQNAPDQE